MTISRNYSSRERGHVTLLQLRQWHRYDHGMIQFGLLEQFVFLHGVAGVSKHKLPLRFKLHMLFRGITENVGSVILLRWLHFRVGNKRRCW